MKTYRIIKSFKGSQTGIDLQEFIAGTEANLSADLAKSAIAEGWAEPVTEVSGATHPLPAGDETEALSLAEDRETKVDAPEENKVEAPAEQKKPGKKKR
jgi:hypothetical protein